VAYRRVSMRKTREILRLKFETRLSQRAVARAMGVSNSTVSDVLARLKASGLSWLLPSSRSPDFRVTTVRSARSAHVISLD